MNNLLPMLKKFALLTSLLMAVGIKATVNPGEIIVLGFEQSNGSNAVQELWFIALAPIDAGEVVNITDGSFGNTSPFALTLGGKDARLSFTVGANGLNVGDSWVIGGLASGTPTLTTARSSVGTSDITAITTSSTWTLEFGTNGDDIWIYQGSTTNATNMVYAVGCGTSGSQLNPSTAGVSANITTWGLTQGLTANYFNFGNSNYKLLGANPNTINFNGSIDDILSDLGNSANYVTDDALTLNGTGSVNLNLGTINPQPANRYWNGIGWFTDLAYTIPAVDPNRTHTTVFTTSPYTTATANLDVAGVVVGDGSSASTFTVTPTGNIKTVYGFHVTNNGTLLVEGGGVLDLGTDIDIDAGGLATFQAPADITYGEDLVVDGTLIIEGGSDGFATLSAASGTISGSGTIRYDLTINQIGWHHVSAPGSVTFNDLTFDNGMTLNFNGPNTNIYSWNAASSSWVVTNANADFGSKAYTVYVSTVPQKMSVPFTPTNFNNSSEQNALQYFNPGNAAPGNATGWASAVTDGWNMMRNPFPAYLDWDILDNTTSNLQDVDMAVYVWNPKANSGSGAYVSYTIAENGTAFGIAPFQAFFVRASGSGTPAVTKPNEARSHNGNVYFGKTNGGVDVQKFSILADVNGFTSEAKIAFLKNDASLNKDKYDAIAWQGGLNSPFLYTTSQDSVALSTNIMPFGLSSYETYLSCFFAQNNAQATISIDAAELDPLYSVQLIDLWNNTTTDLRTQNYTFFTDNNAPTQRFKLLINSNGVSLFENRIENALLVYRQNGKLVLSGNDLNGMAEVEIFDLAGRKIQGSRIEFISGSAELHAYVSGISIIRVSQKEYVWMAKAF